jgi:resuscitation-promoting factor RpfA
VRRRLRRAVSRTARRTSAALGLTLLVSTGLVALGPGAGAESTTETVWDRVAACESGGNWSINTGNGHYGGLQFTFTTWRSFGGQTYAYTADKATKNQQIYTAQQVLKAQGPGAWPTCSVRAGLTVANGLAVVVSPEPPPTAPVASGVIPLVVDGKYGPKSKMATEIWVGGSVNGSLDSLDAKRLQARVGTYQDGIIGPKTTAALQRTVGAYPDGVWGPKTTAALQAYLNRVLG